jgi:hypothetical protein
MTITQLLTNYTNNQLKELLLEIDIISQVDRPSKIQKSKNLANVWVLSTVQYSWNEVFADVKNAINQEVINRFKADNQKLGIYKGIDELIKDFLEVYIGAVPDPGVGWNSWKGISEAAKEDLINLINQLIQRQFNISLMMPKKTKACLLSIEEIKANHHRWIKSQECK